MRAEFRASVERLVGEMESYEKQRHKQSLIDVPIDQMDEDEKKLVRRMHGSLDDDVPF